MTGAPAPSERASPSRRSRQDPHWACAGSGKAAVLPGWNDDGLSRRRRSRGGGQKNQGAVYFQMVPLARTKTEFPSATSEEVWLRSNAVVMPVLKGCQLFPSSELAYIPHWLPEIALSECRSNCPFASVTIREHSSPDPQL